MVTKFRDGEVHPFLSFQIFEIPLGLLAEDVRLRAAIRGVRSVQEPFGGHCLRGGVRPLAEHRRCRARVRRFVREDLPPRLQLRLYPRRLTSRLPLALRVHSQVCLRGFFGKDSGPAGWRFRFPLLKRRSSSVVWHSRGIRYIPIRPLRSNMHGPFVFRRRR